MKTLNQALKEEMWEEWILFITPYLIGILLATIFFLTIRYAVNKNEKVECLRWQNYEKIYRDFHPSEQMNEQCSQYGVEFQP